MKAVHVKRLEKLADFLDTLPRQKFDFGTFGKEEGKPFMEALAAGKHRCGTVACAIGWTPAVFPRLMEWQDGFPAMRESGETCFSAAEELFGIDRDESRWLFNPGPSNNLDNDATPKQVAKHIRKFLKEKQRSEV